MGSQPAVLSLDKVSGSPGNESADVLAGFMSRFRFMRSSALAAGPVCREICRDAETDLDRSLYRCMDRGPTMPKVQQPVKSHGPLLDA